MHDTTLINPARLAAAERKSQPPTLLNEGQAAAFFGVGRRKFHDIRRQTWFTAVCKAVELGPRALRWHSDELLAAAKNAPRVTKLVEPAGLATARAGKASHLLADPASERRAVAGQGAKQDASNDCALIAECKATRELLEPTDGTH